MTQTRRFMLVGTMGSVLRGYDMKVRLRSRCCFAVQADLNNAIWLRCCCCSRPSDVRSRLTAWNFSGSKWPYHRRCRSRPRGEWRSARAIATACHRRRWRTSATRPLVVAEAVLHLSEIAVALLDPQHPIATCRICWCMAASCSWRWDISCFSSIARYSIRPFARTAGHSLT